MSTEFEYRVQTYKLGWKGFDFGQIETDLNELGRQGWDAVSTVAPSVGSGHTGEFGIILKRPRG
ncbi:uncharacterized protein DUF4177 [Tamaricihabitans halophyticus]|uniref:Uncharacterized protein DUF4177 n=1 Tax=Tamaricihabitans halophyticus TaxID=1262583 RepID=A0A4R2QED2_9PSEU|nr:DUF4177 domain-containing protein [Tamaricihabitans halophyticus]TCP47347.1 uncharacterized protein DUF4177 [Tamaricihabitans halophyticus]